MLSCWCLYVTGLVAAVPAWPRAWQAAHSQWCAEEAAWEVHGLELAHTLLPGLRLRLRAESATLRPGPADRWAHVRLQNVSYESLPTANRSTAEPLRIDRLEVADTRFALTVYGYAQTVDGPGYDSLFFAPLVGEDRYSFSTDRMRIHSKSELIRIEGFRMIPRLGVEEFPRELTERATRMSLTVRTLEVNGTDVSDMINKRRFGADSTVIEGAFFTVDTYSYLPKRTDPQRLPHQLLAAVAPDLDLGIIEVKDSRIEVQFNHEDRRSGFLSFGDIRATVRNLRNSAYAVPLDIRVDVRTLLYDQGLANIRFRMPCGTPDGRFWVSGHVGPMDFRAVNEVLVTEGNFRIRRGVVDSLLFRIEANDTLATGEAYPYYRDLKVRKLRGFQSNQPRKFFSSIMDLLGIPDRNPEGGELRIGNVLYARNPQQSFFAYCWNALRTGLLSVMTPNYLLPDDQESEKTKDY